MDKENLDYLNDIAEKAIAYDEVRMTVVEYLLTNQIKDIDLATNLFVIGFLWEASKRNEILTDEDLCMFLDADEDISIEEIDEYKEYYLDEKESSLSLKELLDKTVENFS
jgi:hypothetical protein